MAKSFMVIHAVARKFACVGIFRASLILTLSMTVGCSGYDSFLASMPSIRSVGGPGRSSATQIVPIWQRRLASLPNPLSNGSPTPGLVGQMFFVTADNRPATIDGNLTFTMNDASPRPAGQSPRKAEVAHFDPATLKKLVTRDERFGPCMALFLPWPTEWSDVTVVRLQAMYQQKGMPDLYAGETTIALDFSAPGSGVWTDTNGKTNTAGQPSINQSSMGVPDLMKVLQAEAKSMTNRPEKRTTPDQTVTVPAAGLNPALLSESVTAPGVVPPISPSNVGEPVSALTLPKQEAASALSIDPRSK